MMAKVRFPLMSGDVSGALGKQMIFRRGGVVTRMFRPKDARTAAQLAHRQAFKEYYMASLTQAQADLLYSAITHLHDDRYLQSVPQQDHGGLAGLADDDHSQYLNQARGDARYSLATHEQSIGRAWLPFGAYGVISPISANGTPYAATVDRTITFVKWAQAFYVGTTNNSSNYWKFDMQRANTDVVSTLNTANSSVNVRAVLSTTSFNYSSIGLSDVGLYLVVSKVGSPGNLYISGPTLEVTA